MTPTQTVLAVVAITTLWVAALLLLEYRTLKDKVPANHITAALRASVRALPWPWLLLALVAGFMMGHCFGQ